MVEERHQSDIVEAAFADLRQSQVPDGPSTHALEQTLQAVRQAQARPGRFSLTERIRKMNKFVKYPVAAAVVIALLGGVAVFLLTSTSGPLSAAWAAEQTDQALAHVGTAFMTGTVKATVFEGFSRAGLPEPTGTVTFKTWARKAQKGNGSGDLRMELSDGEVIVVSAPGSRVYGPQTRTLFLTKSHVMSINPWFSSQFKALEGLADNWCVSYGADEHTGRQSAFVTCSYGPHSWWLQFDVESKLPVRFKQWQNPHREGNPDMVAEKIVYDEPVDEAKFELNPPAGATVKEVATQPASAPEASSEHHGDLDAEHVVRLLNNPSDGIPVGTMTQSQVAEEISRQFVDTMIQDDQSRAARLWPVVAFMSNENWQEIRGLKNPPVQLIKAGPVKEEPDCKLGPVVPCTMKMRDGSGLEIRLVVKFREIDGKTSCVVAGTYGQPRKLPDGEAGH